LSQSVYVDIARVLSLNVHVHILEDSPCVPTASGITA
jgi:hypothetical protein